MSGDLLRRAEAIASGDADRLRRLQELARMVVRRIGQTGVWDGIVEDIVPPILQPLHMAAVREKLGALIPERMQKRHDKAARNVKDDFGELRGGSVLFIDDWRLSVRAEDALARGRLQEDALEFFLKVLMHVCKSLDLSVAVGSKTVGKDVGRQTDVGRFAKIFQKWRQVWPRDEVREREELILPVAVDEKNLPQDWMLVSVRSCVSGQKLGEAQQLCVQIYDSARRDATARRVAKNLDALIRGLAARGEGMAPVVEFAETPTCRMGSQRNLCALGLLVGRVASAAQENGLDVSSEAFVPDVACALRALFAHFRKESGEQGVRDVDRLLSNAESCRAVLRRLCSVPVLAGRRDVGTEGAAVQSFAPVIGGDRSSEGCGGQVRALRVATWNIAGGHCSAQAPEKYNALDQRAAVTSEILRWCRVFGCDVIALQECESERAYDELLGAHDLVATKEAVANRGYVHVYVRRGMPVERVELDETCPGVAVRVTFDGEGESAKSVCVVAVHLPTGDGRGKRQRILEQVCDKCASCKDKIYVVGDMNVKNDTEVKDLCKQLDMQEARYAGVSWGVKDNRFYKDSSYSGPGLRKDRVLFGKKVWAEAHLVGQAKRFFAGHEFYVSDHFGVMSYVDCGDMYASLAKQDSVVARSRRGQLVALRDQAQQKELVEVRALRQAGREDMEFARRRAAERDRADFQRAQQRAARQRRGRRARLRETAFGAAGLFAESVVAVPDGVSNNVPSAPADLSIRVLDDMPRGTWATTGDLPLRGLKNVGNTCYLNSVAQVLMRTPAVVEWMSRHHADGCPKDESGCALCSLFLTYSQVLSGFAHDDKTPVLAARRAEVDGRFGGREQHDVVEFFEKFLECVRDVEIAAGRCSTWENIQIAERRATHVERLFGFVRETRRRCRVCRGGVRSWFSGEHVLRVEPKTMPGGPMTVAEMYFDSCSPAEDDDAMYCPMCEQNTKHDCQSRMLTAPNVLIVQLKRNSPRRPGIDAEVQLDLLGFPSMELVGVLYHNGATFKSGHYTCLCRGPEGRFWTYNDDHPVHALNKDVAHIKPKEAYMLVYCRSDGSAVWKQHENEDAEVVQIDGDDDRGGGSGNGGGASC